MNEGLTDWRPMHDAHATQVASITIQFAQALTEIPWQKALATGRESGRKLGLITENPIASFELSIGPNAGSQAFAAMQGTLGLSYCGCRHRLFLLKRL